MEELEAASATIQSLTALLRLIQDRIRISGADDLAGLKSQADEIEAQIVHAVKRLNQVN